MMKSYGIAMGGKIYSLRVAKRMTQEQLAEDFKIRTILRNIDNVTLAAAMYGASGRVVRRFFENISDSLLYFVNEDMEQWHGTEEEILAAQRQVLELGAWAEGRK